MSPSTSNPWERRREPATSHLPARSRFKVQGSKFKVFSPHPPTLSRSTTLPRPLNLQLSTFNFQSTLALLLITLALLPSALADSISLTPVADSYMQQAQPDANWGGSTIMTSGTLGPTASFENRRALLRFDVSNLPPGAVVTNVTVTVVVTMRPGILGGGGPAASEFDLRRVLVPWDEGQVTWNSRLSGVPWSEAGAGGTADVSEAASSSTFVDLELPYLFPSTPQLVADVQQWANAPSSNFGWLLISELEGTSKTARQFGTRESFGNAPTLTVFYTLQPLTITTEPESQSVIAGSTVNFTVGAAGGVPPITYQWFFNNNPIAGATSNVLTLDNVQTNQTGDYVALVANQLGTTNSQPAHLTVVPPFVALTSPTNGSRFPAGTDVLLAATTTNGTVAQIQYYTNNVLVGTVTNPPFTLTLSNLAPGTYTITARVTDTETNTFPSPSASITVFAAPQVVLKASAALSSVGAPVTLTATVSNRAATITNVQFFANGDLIGTGTGTNAVFVWNPTTRGDFILTAQAIDQFGQQGSSPPVTIRIFQPELIPPSIRITAGPGNFARVTQSPITLSGTAADNLGIDHVEYQIASGPFLQNLGGISNAIGGSNWTARINLMPGKNAVFLRAVDQAANKSPTLTRYYTLFAEEPLQLKVNGAGTVTPKLASRTLQLGKTYSLTAHAASGQIFAGWGADTNTPGTTLTFQMQSNLVVVANFIPSPFASLAGSYNGLFFDADTNRFRPENAGSLKLQLSRNGAFSGKVVVQGDTVAIHGSFDYLGRSRVPLLRHSTASIALSVNLDLTNTAGIIHGTVTNAHGGGVLTSPLLAQRNPFDGQNNPAPQAGTYSFSFTSASDPAPLAGTARINPSGSATFNGTLSGKNFHVNTALGADGNAPFYLARNKGAETLAGWLQFTNSTINGQLFWASPSSPSVILLNAGAPRTPPPTPGPNY